MSEDRPVTDLGTRPDAVRRYVASMRRRRRWYFVAIAAVVAAAVAVALAVWSTGEITHTRMRTAATPPADVTPGTPAAQPAPAWRNGDASAIGAPFTGGTVVTYSEHTVTGRNALTGQPDWTYTRSDRTVCQVAQLQGKTVAFFADGGNCDEVTALDTGTGERAWTRTLFENGLPINGRPAVVADSDALFISTSRAIYAIGVSEGACDPDTGTSCGGDMWTFRPDPGCTITSIAPGSLGVLIGEHCAAGDQLLLRDRNKGDDDDQKTDDKKHQIIWRLKNTSGVPAFTGTAVAALDPATHELVTYDDAKGTVTGRSRLDPAPATSGPVLRAALSAAQLLWVDGHTYALNSSGTQLWSAATSTLPTVTPRDGLDTTPTLSGARLLVPTASGVAALNPGTGAVTTRYPVTPPPGGSQVFPLGSGLLVAGTTTAVYQ